MPFLDQHSADCENHDSVSLTKKHLLSENSLFGSREITASPEQILNQEHPSHPRDCIDHKEDQVDNETDHTATSRRDTSAESSLPVDHSSAEHHKGCELPETGSNELNNIGVSTEREAPGPEPSSLRPRASSESESINALYCSGVFDFDQQMRTSSPRILKAAASRRQIDSPMVACQQVELSTFVGVPSAIDIGSEGKSQIYDWPHDVIPECFSQHAKPNFQTGLTPSDEFKTWTELPHMWTDESVSLMPRTAYVMTEHANERMLSRIQQPAAVRSVLQDQEHGHDSISSATWQMPPPQPGRGERMVGGWDSLPQHHVCCEGEVMSLGNTYPRLYNRDTRGFEEHNTMTWNEPLQQSHGMGVAPQIECANTTIEALDRAVEYEAAVDKLRGSWEELDASNCQEEDLQRDFTLQKRDISHGIEIGNDNLPNHGNMLLMQYEPLGRRCDRGSLESFWKPRR